MTEENEQKPKELVERMFNRLLELLKDDKELHEAFVSLVKAEARKENAKAERLEIENARVRVERNLEFNDSGDRLG